MPTAGGELGDLDRAPDTRGATRSARRETTPLPESVGGLIERMQADLGHVPRHENLAHYHRERSANPPKLVRARGAR